MGDAVVTFETELLCLVQFKARLHLLHKNIKQCKKEVKCLTSLSSLVSRISSSKVVEYYHLLLFLLLLLLPHPTHLM